MKRFKSSLLVLTLGLIFISHVVLGQQKVLNTPGKYLMPMDDASGEMPGSSSRQGELWVVFSDRPANILYSDRSCSSPSGKRLGFMEPFYVIDETDKAVRIVGIEFADYRGNLRSGYAASAGWVLKSSMLLWRTCLKTRDVNLPDFEEGIFNKKAMVLNIIAQGQKDYRPPIYYDHPRCTEKDSINAALVYQINFVYKETDDAYLLAEVPEITDLRNDIPKIKGWVQKRQTTPWNHRLAYEPNWDKGAVAERKKADYKAQIFEKSSDVARPDNPTGRKAFEESDNFYTKRALGELDRFPVLNIMADNVSKVGVIGHLQSSDGKKISREDFAKIKHIIDSVSTALRNVNIMFVVDATSSLLPYSESIQKALSNTMRDLSSSNNNFKFGVLLYRDAAEGEKNVRHYNSGLTSSYQQVNKFLRMYMQPQYNACDTDQPEAMYYGIKSAIDYFNPPEGESNFIVLVGDAGNHTRSTYTDCSGKAQSDYTVVDEKELIQDLADKDINLISFQVHHNSNANMRPAYDDFRTQVKDLMTGVAATKKLEMDGDMVSNLLVQEGPTTVALDSTLGMPSYFTYPPDGQSINTNSFTTEIEKSLKYINSNVEEQVNNIAKFLTGKVKGTNVKQLANFIHKLEEYGIPPEQLQVIFEKNGQLYWTGYTKRFVDNLKAPLFQDVLLMSHGNLYTIKRALERLIPPDEFSMPENDYRAYLVYTWGEILVDILGYFPEHNEAIDTLSLYTLSSILTGWGGKKKFQQIRLEDVIDQTRFPSEMLYEYLMDWCFTKGHIQSIYDGQNLLTSDFFEDHRYSIFFEFLYVITMGDYDSDPELIDNLGSYFSKHEGEYNNYEADFKIPIGTGSGTKYYWVDARIFPHDSDEFNDEDVIKKFYKNYLKEE